MRTVLLVVTALSLTGAVCFALGRANAGDDKRGDHRVYELRTYYVAPGKMSALHARFRDHTCKLV